ncbi:MAG: ABC transporter permease [Anaerolineales bacterium]|nr:MAG: ABC transporter permease [Anaerolineales bacterium]
MIQIRALQKLVIAQVRLSLRDPMGVFFILLFAPLLLIFMGFIFGNEPDPMSGGRGALDVFLPSYAAIVIAVVGLMSVSVETTGRREAGVLRRFRATPLRPLTYILGDVLTHFAMTILGIFLLFLLGVTVYKVRFDGSPLPLIMGICLSTAAFISLGFVLASLAPNPRTATIIGNVLLFPMMALSGTTFPLELMPEAVRNTSRFVPMTHVVTLLRGLWFGETFGEHLMEVAVLGGIIIMGTIIATWTFRWE